MMRKIERENTGLLKPGQDLVVAGYAGLAGSVLLVKEKDQYERLRGWFSEEWLDQAGEWRSRLSKIRSTGRRSERQTGRAQARAVSCLRSGVSPEPMVPEWNLL